MTDTTALPKNWLADDMARASKSADDSRRIVLIVQIDCERERHKREMERLTNLLEAIGK